MGLRSTVFATAGAVAAVAVGVAVWAWWPQQHLVGAAPGGAAMTGWEAQIDLPLSTFSPDGIAVSREGDVYVAGYQSIEKLPAGRFVPEQVPIPGLSSTSGIALGPAGDLYITDYTKGRILKLAPGTSTPVPLPFTGLGERDPAASSRPVLAGVGVDQAGDVFVTDPENSRVLKLPAGSDTPVELLTVDHLAAPIAVSYNGDVAVAVNQPAPRLITIAAGTTAGVDRALPGFEWLNAMAFDHRGGLLLADHRRIENPGDRDHPWTDETTLWTLPPGSTAPIRLPFTDLGEVAGIAVDPSGDPVVTDSEGERVLKLRLPH
ncbi:Serine/threonine-protein kinase PknD [Nocardia cerradoensis]|uniref:Serine/threonine-protein kinase PknD n=1 Tax=Nocardia cerradoensis TaxID=85688 RepID=A0A231GT16_9NOCA|nr:hypothetical protein [Nocardia cerradoensis]OXR39767.1 Serine/threonine-protein kinase PknD [Nocardia cerradoensis]